MLPTMHHVTALPSMSNYNGSSSTTENKDKVTSPSRPRHQISRSISELSPIRLHRSHQQHHHLHHHSSRHRDRDDTHHNHHFHSTSTGLAHQAATGTPLPSRGSLDVPRATTHRTSRSEAADSPHNLTPNQSRRGSILVSGLPNPAASTEDGTMSPTIGALLGAGLFAGGPALPSARKRSTAAQREEQLRQEQLKAAARADGLKSSLVELNDFSNATTRRLDDSYYSVLEKVGQLQNTVLALKELAGMSAQTDEQFRTESRDLVDDVTAQIDAFGEFDEQARKIQGLTARIRGGRDKVRALGERVEAVREKIERWERADREWQERTRKRLKAIWVVLSGLVLLVVVLLVAVQFISPGVLEQQEVHPGVHVHEKKGLVGIVLNRTTHHPIDETLRVFDEL